MAATKTRFVVVKTFGDSETTRVDLANGRPIYATIVSKHVNLQDYDVPLNTSASETLKMSNVSTKAWDFFSKDPLFSAMMISADKSEIIPLAQQFDFVAGESYNREDLNASLRDTVDKGATLWGTLTDRTRVKSLANLAVDMFSAVNPKTGMADVSADSFYAPFIPLVTMANVLPPQKDENGQTYFNPEGAVSVMEFLDGINAIKSQSNSNENRKLSIDNVSNENDYFNEGYLSCLSRGRSSLFYKLYTRRELAKPITRLELAYITVLCWRDFTAKYDNVNGGRFVLGCNADWSRPARYLRKFKDGLSYKVYKKSFTVEDSNELGTVVDLRVYKGDLSVSEFIEAMRKGQRGIPLPLIMCLVELDILDLFYFEAIQLDPLREVSRGELTYFLVKLAKTFPTKFISKGDNSYN